MGVAGFGTKSGVHRPVSALGYRADRKDEPIRMSTPNPHDVVLLCNPQAGGRWRALADVLDSDEAKGVRRIVTDEIDDVAEALSSVGRRARLLCIYGGDGTIYHVINQLLSQKQDSLPRLAFLGGGTMNVTGRLCGMTGSPGDNFRAVMRAYLTDQLLWRDLPLVEVQQGGGRSYGYTFGMGALVRILNRYEHGRKGKLAALGIGAQAITAALSPVDLGMKDLMAQMSATVTVDGETLPYERFIAVFANTTGAVNRMVEPFVHQRSRDHFNFLAYSVSAREFAFNVPNLMRAQLPLDHGSLPSWLLQPRNLLSLLRGQRKDLPADPRYVNHPAQSLRIETDEPFYTLDGEVLPLAAHNEACRPATASPRHVLHVRLGPSLQLALVGGAAP